MLFFISFLMVFVSSYLLASIFSPKDKNNCPKSIYPFLLVLIIMFAQIVLTFEVLSLFSLIKEQTVLLMNILFLGTSIHFWNKNNKPLYKPKFKNTLTKILNALKKDTILKIFGCGFVFFILATILLIIFMPVDSSDALVYHLNRASYWLFQGNLNHFTIADDRNLVMPINSEILYLWNLLFFKNDIGLYFVSFIGYITILFSVYNILQLFGFSERKKLWTIFILSSFASVIAQISSLETDVLIAGLVLCSITLFLYSLKDDFKQGIYFSALAYALAMGTKTPAIIVLPGVIFLLSVFAFKKHKTKFYKPIGIFLIFLFLNFIVFSSYNYILNFADFGNFLGSESSRAIHGFRGGIKAYIANYIRYIFMMFDFSGFKYSEYVGEYIINAKLAIFEFLKIPPELGVEMSDNNEINNRFVTVKTGTGMLGFLVFLPAVIISGLLSFKKDLNKKIKNISVFAWMFFINIACLSGAIAYMVYSVRFLTFIVLLSTPVLAITYIKKTNVFKILILFFVMSYFLVMSVNLAGRQHIQIAKVIKNEKSLSVARERIRCSLYTGFTNKRPLCFVKEFIQTKPEGTKIGVFTGAMDAMYLINMLNTQGYKIDTLMAELATEYDLEQYDYVINTNKVITSTVLLTNTENIKTPYIINKDGSAGYPEYKDNFCLYETNKKKFYHESLKNDIVVASRCIINPSFMIKRNFVPDKMMIFSSEENEFNRTIYIYKNKNLQ